MRIAVVGAGVVGLSTAVALLDAGADVICLEARGPMSQRSAGSSRVFRLAHTTPVLVELAERSRRMLDAWGGLVAPVSAVMAGPDADRWAAAMAEAGAAHELRPAAEAGLPTSKIDGPCVVDPAGGVLDAEGTGRYLLSKVTPVRVAVDRIEESPDGVIIDGRRFDTVVIAAGFGTPALAAHVGLRVPADVHHHVRFTFPIDPAARPPALIDRSETWQPGFTTYQHLTAPGRWAVGAHFDPEAVAWPVGREAAVEASRRRTVEYVRDNLDGIGDEVLDELYCNVVGGWADGYGVARTARVIAVHGDNLFKLAPMLGVTLAAAALDGSLPASTLTP